MKIGTRIKILPSHELDRIGLMPLAGITGTLMQAVHNDDGTLRGCWLRLPGRWNGEREWFIPAASLSII